MYQVSVLELLEASFRSCKFDFLRLAYVYVLVLALLLIVLCTQFQDTGVYSFGNLP